MRKSVREKYYNPETGAMLKRFQYRDDVRLPEGTFAFIEDSQKKLLIGEKQKLGSMLWELATDRFTLVATAIGVVVVASELL